MKNPKWVVLGRDNCPYCTRATKALSQAGYEFTYTKLTDPENAPLKQFILNCGLSTVPQIYINGQRLGGWEELELFLKEIKSHGE